MNGPVWGEASEPMPGTASRALAAHQRPVIVILSAGSPALALQEHAASLAATSTRGNGAFGTTLPLAPPPAPSHPIPDYCGHPTPPKPTHFSAAPSQTGEVGLIEKPLKMSARGGPAGRDARHRRAATSGPGSSFSATGGLRGEGLLEEGGNHAVAGGVPRTPIPAGRWRGWLGFVFVVKAGVGLQHSEGAADAARVEGGSRSLECGSLTAALRGAWRSPGSGGWEGRNAWRVPLREEDRWSCRETAATVRASAPGLSTPTLGWKRRWQVW